MSLKKTVEELANQFAADLLNAIRGTSLEEILAETGRSRPHTTSPTRGTARRARGSSGPDATLVRIENALRAHGSEMRSEDLRKEVGVEKGAFSRAIAQAVEAKRITKHGARRATTYRLAS